MKTKTKTKPWGLRGGHDAETNGMLVYPGSDHERWTLMQRFAMAIGDGFWNYSGGGGGYGHPLERDPEAVVEDVLDGYVSSEAAREVYGVIVSADGSWEETARRREHASEHGPD